MRREPTEQMELEFVPLEDAVQLACSGGILDAPSAMALLLVERRLRSMAR